MQINEHIFREYDIRGIIDKDLNPDVAFNIGLGFGTYIRRIGGKLIVTGRDARETSGPYQRKVIKGLLECGLQVINIGEVPTPVVSYAVKKLLKEDTDGAITITASHNPVEYNGFKIKTKKYPVWGKSLQEIKTIIESRKFVIAQEIGKSESRDILNDYIENMIKDITLTKKVKVVVDAGNGTTGPVAPVVLEKLGCEVIQLYCEPDGTFPNHIADPTVPKYMVDLQKKVVETGADLGIAYDGDGDRVGAVDEKGNLIPADILLLLYSQQLLENPDYNKNIVFDVKCSLALIQGIEKAGGTPHIWKTGYPNILNKMNETESLLGGEMSGHIFFRDKYLGFDDGIYASLRLLEILTKSGKKMSEIINEIPKLYSTPEIRVECSEAEKTKIVSEMGEYLQSKGDLITVDGYRLAYDDGWGLLRASNTQAALVLRFEAKTEEKLNEIRSIFMDKLNSYSSIKWK